jgi:hypothetical protein
VELKNSERIGHPIVPQRRRVAIPAILALLASALLLGAFNYWSLKDYFATSLESDTSYLTTLNLVLLFLGEGIGVLLLWRLFAVLRSPSHARRKMQFSIRALLGLMVLVSVGMLYYRYARDIKQAESEAENRAQVAASLQRLEQQISNGRLYLVDHTFTPHELEHLATDSRVTEVGIVRLAELSGLRTLHLNRNRLNDAALAHLTKLEHLEILDLMGVTGITDEGLKHVSQIENLNALILQDTRLTDAGIEHLKEMRNLTRLWLQGTRVSIAGVNELKQALPNCSIGGP